MRYVNPGFIELFDYHTSGVTTENTNLSTNYYIYKDRGNEGIYRKILDNPTQEVWFQMYIYTVNGSYSRPYFYIGYLDQSESIDKDISRGNLPGLLFQSTSDGRIWIIRVTRGFHSEKVLYNPGVVFDCSDGKYHNIEFHMKTSEEGSGRIDLWIDHKLALSYRSPSQFRGNLAILNINSDGAIYLSMNSIILQDTRRIGLERFVRLDTDKPTEQSFLAGTSTDFVLSNYPEGTEYEDITGVYVAFQGTSRDSAITEGKFRLNGADIGTIDVSDSSGKAWEMATAEVNSSTGEKWRREDIEGKKLTFTVGGDF